MDEIYFDTVIDAARKMPTTGKLPDRTRFVYDKLLEIHPQIAWAVQISSKGDKFESSFMWFSEHVT